VTQRTGANWTVTRVRSDWAPTPFLQQDPLSMMGDSLTRIRPGTPPFFISNGAGLAKGREIGFILLYSFFT
jgi:hypothetical protein